MRQWALSLGVLALIVGGIMGAYLWHRHENGIERIVHSELRAKHISADWVSCANDHTVLTKSATLTYYKCNLHGEHLARRDGVVPEGGAVCIPFVGGRVATPAEAGRVPLEKTFCEGFG